MHLVTVHAFAQPISQFCAHGEAWLGELIAPLSGLTSPSSMRIVVVLSAA